jgi:hypothetical protein
VAAEGDRVDEGQRDVGRPGPARDVVEVAVGIGFERGRQFRPDNT